MYVVFHSPYILDGYMCMCFDVLFLKLYTNCGFSIRYVCKSNNI